jgi:hypothetical protein
MRASALAPLVAAALLAACPAPHVPGPEDAAAYLGIAAGSTLAFQSGAVEATIEMRASSVLRDEALVFDLLSKESGFVNDDRTFSIAVSAADARLVRFFDCISKCGQPNTDIPFLAVPLVAGDSFETQVDVKNIVNGQDAGTSVETHTIIVGDEAEVTVPAGAFTGFTLSWSRVRDDVVQTSLMTIVPDTGIVSWSTFDGAELERK